MNSATANLPGGAVEAPAPDNYFVQVIPEPYHILGLRLRPLSVGRYRLLRRFECAFVADGNARAGVGDLLLGVLICSMSVDEFIEFASSPGFNKAVRKWGRSVVPMAWLGMIPWFGKHYRARLSVNLAHRIKLFQDYLETAQAIPRYTLRDNAPARNSRHWSHSIESTLRSELGWSSDEINEAPLSKALADYFEFAERQGLITLLDDADMIEAEHNAARVELAFAEWRKGQS